MTRWLTIALVAAGLSGCTHDYPPLVNAEKFCVGHGGLAVARWAYVNCKDGTSIDTSYLK